MFSSWPALGWVGRGTQQRITGTGIFCRSLGQAGALVQSPHKLQLSSPPRRGRDGFFTPVSPNSIIIKNSMRARRRQHSSNILLLLTEISRKMGLWLWCGKCVLTHFPQTCPDCAWALSLPGLLPKLGATRVPSSTASGDCAPRDVAKPWVTALHSKLGTDSAHGERRGGK